VAQKGHRTVREPAEKRGSIVIVDRVGIGPHASLKRLPVGDGGAYVGQHMVKLGDQFAPVARIGAVDLQIHHGFAAGPIVAQWAYCLEAVIVVATHADHRMEESVDDEAARGDRHRHGIDEEGHVVVDDADAHPTVAELAAHRFKPDERDAPRAPLRAGGDEGCGVMLLLVAEIGDLAGKSAVHEETLKLVHIRKVSGFVRCHVARGDTVRIHLVGSQPRSAETRRRLLAAPIAPGVSEGQG
jgi:hypothetical protein